MTDMTLREEVADVIAGGLADHVDSVVIDDDALITGIFTDLSVDPILVMSDGLVIPFDVPEAINVAIIDTVATILFIDRAHTQNIDPEEEA